MATIIGRTFCVFMVVIAVGTGLMAAQCLAFMPEWWAGLNHTRRIMFILTEAMTAACAWVFGMILWHSLRRGW